MRWARPIALCLLLCSLSLLSAQEAPSFSTETEPLSPSVSQRLRALAETLKQATTGSRDDLELLLQELQTVSSGLEESLTSVDALEKDSASMKASYKTCSSSLMSSIESEEKERRAKKTWRTAAAVEAAVIAVLVLVK